MRQLVAAAFGAAILLSTGGLATAAGPIEVEQPQGQISIGLDETKTLKFGSQIGKIELPNEGIVRAVPQSGTQIQFTGLSSGRTPLVVYGRDGARLYNAMITVTAEPGHLVRIYRPPTKEEMAAASRGNGKVDAADEYWCTSTICNSSNRASTVTRDR